MRSLIGSVLVVGLTLMTMAKAEGNVEALQAVSEGTNKFSSKFFQTVVEENPGNLIMSPLSAAVALAMAAYGSRGQTEEQFKKVLQLPSPNNFGVSGYQALIDNLNNVRANKLAVANKVFVAEHFNVKPTYKDLTQTYFRSASQLVNFANSGEAANTINTWVQQNTNNLIKDIVEPSDLNALTRLVLVNAVYFKGLWKDKFDPTFTKDMPFHVTKDTIKNVPTMYREGKYKYGELPEMNAKFVVIPYKDDELSMVIVLPNEVNGLSAVEQKLQGTSLTDILNRGYEREVQLFLPKFKVETMLNLNGVLEKMGLTDAFTTRANFSGIADEGLAISKVIQKAFIEVNEEGSEAAAVTGIIAEAYALPVIENKIYFPVDRPFFYSIINTPKTNESLQTLFYGNIVDPSA